MTVRTKVIGRQPTDHGPYDPNLAYGEKFQCTLFGCSWESKHDNNTTAPAVWDGGDTITPNLVDWKKVSGSYESWLLNVNKPATTGSTGDYPYNGMGRVELSKNMVGGVNTLTQDMFYKGAVGSRVPNTNTIFVIRYDYEIPYSMEDVTIPLTNTKVIDGVTYYYTTVPIQHEQKLTLLNSSLVLLNGDSIKGGTGSGRSFGDASRNKINDGVGGYDNTVVIASTTAGTYTSAYMLQDFIIIPNNSILKFEGGSINEGFIELTDGCQMLGNREKMTNLSICLKGDSINIDNIELSGTVNSDLTNMSAAIFDPRTNIFSELNISNCIIHHYNCGIYCWSWRDVMVNSNLIYSIGSNTEETDAQVEILFYGGSDETAKAKCKRFYIINNKCLSRNVHRGIAIAPVSAEDDIVIDKNMCISCDDNLMEAIEGRCKEECIFVDYNGSKPTNKHVHITNNICKHATWGGLYCRSQNTTEGTWGSGAYIYLISGNYIEDVRQRTSGQSEHGGMFIELRESSLISNNIVIDCFNGIHIGVVPYNSAVTIVGNTIRACNCGIFNEEGGHAWECIIKDNTFIKCIEHSVFLQNTTSDAVAYDRYITIQNNNISLPVCGGDSGVAGYNAYGIYLHAIKSKNCLVSGNHINGGGKSDNQTGVYLRFIDDSAGFSVKNNILNSCKNGIFMYTPVWKQNTNAQNIDYNTFLNCATAIGLTDFTGYANKIFILRGNIFTDCTSISNDSYEYFFFGDLRVDGTLKIEQTNIKAKTVDNVYLGTCPVSLLSKYFKKGDEVVFLPQDIGDAFYFKMYFSRAICQTNSMDELVATKWFAENLYIRSEFRPHFAVKWQRAYDMTISKYITYNGSNWVDDSGNVV